METSFRVKVAANLAAIAVTFLAGGEAWSQVFPGGRVEQTSLHIVGTLEPDDIERAAAETRGFATCYQTALRRNPTIDGLVVLSWVVHRDGTSADRAVHRSELADRSLEGCLLDAVAAMRFSTTEAREAVVMLALTLTSEGGLPFPPPPFPPPPITPQLSAAQIRAVFDRNIADLAFCRTSSGQPPWPTVEIPVRLTIERSGQVRSVRTESTNPAARCVVGVVEGMVFPSFSGPDLILTYPVRI